MRAMIALALAVPLALAPVRPDAIRIDAFFDDWEGRPVMRLDEAVRGRVDDAADLGARIQVAWTTESLLVAAQVVDNRYQPGDGQLGDRLTLVWGSPPHQLEIVLRDLESPPPTARVDGRDVPGAKAQGTYRKDGWAVEAAVPLAALPGLVGEPVAFAAVIHDADEGREAEAVRATAPVDGALVPQAVTLQLSATAGLWARFEAEQPHAEPMRTLTGNLVGNPALPEEIRISPQEIVLLGHELPAGMGYAFATHGWRASPTLTTAELRNLDGRPGDELYVVHREWAVPGETEVEVAEIWGFSGGILRCLFAQKIAERSPGFGGEAVARIELVGGEREAARIEVHPAEVKGFNPGNYTSVDPPNMPFQPLPMPWEEKKPQRYHYAAEGWVR